LWLCEANLALLLLQPLETLLHQVGLVFFSSVEVCTALQQMIDFKSCCWIEAKVTVAVFTLHRLVARSCSMFVAVTSSPAAAVFQCSWHQSMAAFTPSAFLPANFKVA
jgi:hypothetical protein